MEVSFTFYFTLNVNFVRFWFLITSFIGLKYPRAKATYQCANQQTEKVCNFLYTFCVCVIVPGFVSPKAIYSFFVYFSTDLGPNAFELPFPTWSVFQPLNLFFLRKFVCDKDG